MGFLHGFLHVSVSNHWFMALKFSSHWFFLRESAGWIFVSKK